MISRAFLIVALLCSYPVRSQVLMADVSPSGTARLFPSDEAVLENREPVTALPCTVKPVQPELGFDFAFHAGYEVRLRLKDLAGAGDILTTIFRVTPEGAPNKAVYFQQKWRVPPIRENAGGTTLLEGSISLGEGDYQVDWLMRDTDERVCSAFWKVAARLATKDGPLPSGLATGAAVPTANNPLSGYEGIAAGSDPITLAVLLNIGSPAKGATLSPHQREVLLSMLRGIEGDPRIENLSLTAFNLEQSQVIFQQEKIRRIDFDALDGAINSLHVGTISVNQLAERDAEVRFLVQLAGQRAKQGGANALIFIGPKMAEERSATGELLQRLGEAGCPVFYLTYSASPEPYPWPDLIGRVVKYWRGREFNIRRPLDLLSAWSKIMSQLGKADPGGIHRRAEN